MKELGVFFSCFREVEAVKYSIKIIREIYPHIPIYLISDGGADFSFLEKEYSRVYTSLEADTMSDTFKITDQNFKEDRHQKAIKNCALAILNRLENSIAFLKTPYILMMDPDTLVRGKLHIPPDAKLLGSRINHNFPIEYRRILEKVPHAKVINSWGATPALFEVESFLQACKFLQNNMNIFDELCKSFYAIYAHDVLLPTIYALIGIEETFNPDIVECLRKPGWEKTSKPLVHQFRKYYSH